ncbi:hypothetical protein SHI21_09620 [Bacteriovorax sp. PP10]|uniref:Uncharacterized protein n=1 Tax=Bacteriovorax antarcticus TaxID=3088717 RepID=A0ABU5VV14_9BACT|nr:hypothetical protein [Bacteriovorax sp. PP10]MEA9356462.1 hypothetical protein [Bacteriovorax sp. PP10]
MKTTLIALLLLVSPKGFSKTIDYKCDFVWKTLSENASFKEVLVKDKFTQKITEGMNAIVTVSEKTKMLSVKEIYKDNEKNFVEYSFSCEQTLNCSGLRISVVDGKKETQKIESVSTSTYGLGKIDSRELFQYKNIVSGFSFDYIVYKNEASEPMGLKVSCRSQK